MNQPMDPGTQINISSLTAPVLAGHAQSVSFTESIKGWLQVTQVYSQQEADLLGMEARRIADARDQMLATRNGGMNPIKQLMQWIESLFPMEPIKFCDAVIEHLKSVAGAYMRAEREKLQQSLALATTPTEVARATQAAVAVPVGFTERESWGWEPTDLNAVPREYWILDTKRLDKEAKTRKGALAVPGIRAVRSTDLARAARR